MRAKGRTDVWLRQIPLLSPPPLTHFSPLWGLPGRQGVWSWFPGYSGGLQCIQKSDQGTSHSRKRKMLFCWLAVCSEDQTFKGALSPGLIPKIKAIWTLQWTEAYFSSCENIRRLKPDQSLGINFTRFCLSHYLSVLPALILLSSILPYPNISNSLWRSLVLLGFSGYHNFFMNCFPQNQSSRLPII